MNQLDNLVSSYLEMILVKTICTRNCMIAIAEYLQSSKKYALKVFPTNKLSSNSYTLENNIHSSLRHPNIIQYIPAHFLLKQSKSPPDNIIFMEYAPFGDLFDFILDYEINDEKLIRTFFHHLIEGLEYLHSRKVAHLDIKLENLLLGEDYLLKIADFDLAREISHENPSIIANGGTANYRPLEVLSGTCVDYTAVDIYSAGVCLFTLMTRSFPFIEENNEGNINLFRYETFLRQNEEFWRQNESLAEGKWHFSRSLKELLNGMWSLDPCKRLTLEEIKHSRWYNGEIYQPLELKERIVKIFENNCK